MNCHGNNSENNEKGKGHKGHLGHMLMMALCCGAPIIIILLLPVIGRIGGPGISKALTAIVPFLCPLMMIFMIPMMFRGKKNKGEKTQDLE